MQIIKSGWEHFGVFNSNSAADRERFAAFYAEQLQVLNRKRAQHRTSHFHFTDLQQQDDPHQHYLAVVAPPEGPVVGIGPVAARYLAEFAASVLLADRAA